eukprot:m.307530 g.307530  ORF g.307530 m.307530 type:complete len:142 (+) comp42406_c0_seq1:1117-1542(+)
MASIVAYIAILSAFLLLVQVSESTAPGGPVRVTLRLRFNSTDRPDRRAIRIVVPSGSDVFRVLLRAQALNFVRYRFDYNIDPTFGAFVLGFGGQQQNPAQNLFWFFFANDVLLPTGVSTFIVSNGDAIEARYQTFVPHSAQ